MQLATTAIHAAWHGDPTVVLHGGSCSVPIHQSTAYLYKDSDYAAEIFQLNFPG